MSWLTFYAYGITYNSIANSEIGDIKEFQSIDSVETIDSMTEIWQNSMKIP